MTARPSPPQHPQAGDGERPGLLTVQDLARRLGMSPRWIHERTRLRQIPHYRLGRSLRFDLEEVRAWLAQYRSAPAPLDTRRVHR
jgi:excisionase family DNA binding protein